MLSKRSLWTIRSVMILMASMAVSSAFGYTPTSGESPGSLGEVSNTLTGILAGAHGIIEIASYLLGAAIGISAILKYRIHRRNAQQIPLSTPITEAIVALVFLALPFIIEFSSTHEVIKEATPITPGGQYTAPTAPAKGTPGQAPRPASPYPY